MSVEAVTAVMAATGDLTRVEKLVLLAFAWRSGADGYDVWTGGPGSVECAAWAMVTEDHAGRIVRSLRDRGLLELVEKARQHHRARYRLVEEELRARRPSGRTGARTDVRPSGRTGAEKPQTQSADSPDPVSPHGGKRKKNAKKLSISPRSPGKRRLPHPSPARAPAREKGDATQRGDEDIYRDRDDQRDELQPQEQKTEKTPEADVLEMLARLSAGFDPDGYDMEERRHYWSRHIPEGQGKMLTALFMRVALDGRRWSAVEPRLEDAEREGWPADKVWSRPTRRPRPRALAGVAEEG